MTESSPVTHYHGPRCERPGKVGPLVPSTRGPHLDPATGATWASAMPAKCGCAVLK